MTTRIITIISIALVIAVTIVPSLTAQTSAPAEKISPESQKAIDLFDAGIRALNEDKKVEAITNFDDMLKILTPQVALDILAAKGPEAFDRLFEEGGEFAKIARIVSETASHEVFKQNTDPAEIKKLVETFLDNDAQKSGEAFRQLKYNAGEFAVPHLIDRWRTAPDIKTKATISIALREMGSRISMPLECLLKKPDAPLQLAIIDVFRETREWRVVPTLKAISLDPGQPERVRKAAGETADSIIAATIPQTPVDSLSIEQLYTMVAEDYLAQRTRGRRAVIPSFVLGEHKRVFIWTLENGTPVPNEIAPCAYNEEMAIKLASAALKADPGYSPAYAILIAAHFAEVAEGNGIIRFDIFNKKNLLTDNERSLIKSTLEDTKTRDAWIFAGGESTLFDALAIILKHNRRFAAMLCMDKIAASCSEAVTDHIPVKAEQIGETRYYGAPLVNALAGETKQIAYKAAITLAKICKGSPFLHSDKAAFYLVNAMQAAGTVNVLVVHRIQQARNAIQATLKAMGCVTDATADYETGLRKALAFPLPDIIILSSNLDKDTGKFIVALRDNNVTREIPILIVSTDIERDKNRFDFDAVKGFITDYTDADQIKRLAEGLKKTNNYEEDFNDTIVLEAAETVGKLAPTNTMIDISKHAEEILALATKSSRFEIRKAALTALGNWHITQALPALAKTLAEESVPTEVKIIAAQSIACILSMEDGVSDEVFGLLKLALKNGNEQVRLAIGKIFLQATLTEDQKKQLLP